MRTQIEMDIKNKHAYILRWAKKLKAVEILGKVCCKCGCDDLRVMEFHHTDPTKKELAISTLRLLSWPKIQNEISKCVLLCSRCHFIEHYSTDLIQDNRYRISKNILLEFIGKKECQNCGWSGSPAALHFHHKDPAKKEFLLSDIRIQSLQEVEKNIIDEINKCELLCANCHHNEHTDERYELYKEEIIEKSKNIKQDFFRVDPIEIKRLYIDEGWSAYKIAKFYKKAKSIILHHIHKMGISK